MPAKPIPGTFSTQKDFWCYITHNTKKLRVMFWRVGPSADASRLAPNIQPSKTADTGVHRRPRSRHPRVSPPARARPATGSGSMAAGSPPTSAMGFQSRIAVRLRTAIGSHSTATAGSNPARSNPRSRPPIPVKRLHYFSSHPRSIRVSLIPRRDRPPACAGVSVFSSPVLAPLNRRGGGLFVKNPRAANPEPTCSNPRCLDMMRHGQKDLRGGRHAQEACPRST